VLQFILVSVVVNLIAAAIFSLLVHLLAAGKSAIGVLWGRMQDFLSQVRTCFSPEATAALREHFVSEVSGTDAMDAVGRTLLFAVHVPTIVWALAKAERNPKTQTALSPKDGIAHISTIGLGIAVNHVRAASSSVSPSTTMTATVQTIHR
jgi:hypothetical protein